METSTMKNKYLITPETQSSQLWVDRGALFKGVCSLDGCR